MTLGTRALQVAITQLGKKEEPVGSNFGPDVQKYLNSVGLNFPAFWCAAFAHWCFDQAAAQLQMVNPVPKTGGAIDMLNRTDPKHIVHAPEPGDIFILDFGHGHGHAGIVKEVSGVQFRGVEGNSNTNGSRDGEEVCIPHWRLINSVKGFIRY